MSDSRFLNLRSHPEWLGNTSQEVEARDRHLRFSCLQVLIKIKEEVRVSTKVRDREMG